jgi:hypothetical protein
MVGEAPAQRRASWLVPVILLVVVLLVVVIGVGGYFVAGAAMAASEDRQAVATLESARKHNNQIYDALNAPKLPDSLSNSSDISQAKQALSSYVSALSDANTKLDADLKALNDEDSRLKGDQNNVLLLPERSRLASDRDRVAGMASAFTNAKTAFKILQTQIPVFQALVDVVDGFNSLQPYIDKDDWQGALNVLTQLDPKLQSLVTAASGANIPPEFTNGVKLLKQLADDFKKFLQAVVASDFSTAQSLSATLNNDVKALDNFNPSGMDTYEDNLLKPYKDAYEAGLRKAGFTVTG